MLYELVHEKPDVYRIYLTGGIILGYDWTSAFLIKDGSDALLIDTGFPGDECVRQIQTALTDIGADLGTLRFFITHLHLDHGGSVGRLACSGQKVYLYSALKDILWNRNSLQAHVDKITRLAKEGFAEEYQKKYFQYLETGWRFNPEGLNIDFVDDGDQIKVGQYTFTVVDTRGHTEHHMGLYHEKSAILFSGDHILFEINPYNELFPNGEDSIGLYLTNLAKIRSMRIEHLFCSHGLMDGDLHKRIDEIEDAYRAKFNAMLDVIGKNPKTSGAEIASMLHSKIIVDSSETKVAFAKRVCVINQRLSELEHLVQIGKVIRRIDDNGLFRYTKAPAQQ